jgi:DNA-directed RNA polymerase specialized sigma24 family protein
MPGTASPSQIQHLPQPTPRCESRPQAAVSSADLFRTCAAGNCDGAWREFVKRFHGRLVTAVRRALLRLGAPGANAEKVEDLVQEVYCRLLSGGRRPRSFRGESEAQLMSYLQRVAASVVVDARRVALAEKRGGGHRVAWADWRLGPAVGIGEASGPEDRLLAREQRRAFLAVCRQALGRRATPTTVRIACLALLEGWSSREIAAGLAGRMGIAGIDSVIYRLRRNLARRGIAVPRRDHRSHP